MANAFAAGATGASWDLLTETAYDREVEYYLRDDPQWRQLIDKKPEKQAMPGDVVTLTLHNPLAPLATSPLTETVDPDAVAPAAPNRVLVTIQEWGDPTVSTLRLKELAFTQPEQEIVELLGRNMYDSIDSIIKSVADAGTNQLWMNGGAPKITGGSDASVLSTDYLTRAPATTATTVLRNNKVAPKAGNKFVALINPNVAFDLQAENSATAWVAPHTYGGDTEAVYSGTIGDFMGARYIETTRTTINATAGSGGKPVYSTYYFGRQALVEASVIEPGIVIGPQTDKFKRFFPIGWYAMAGWSLYRPQALLTVRTSSSLAGL